MGWRERERDGYSFRYTNLETGLSRTNKRWDCRIRGNKYFAISFFWKTDRDRYQVTTPPWCEFSIPFVGETYFLCILIVVMVDFLR
jgi:hypothetical protein